MTEIQEGCRLVGGAGSIVGHSISDVSVVSFMFPLPFDTCVSHRVADSEFHEFSWFYSSFIVQHAETFMQVP